MNCVQIEVSYNITTTLYVLLLYIYFPKVVRNYNGDFVKTLKIYAQHDNIKKHFRVSHFLSHLKPFCI